jgi:hypothetical protein
VGGTSLTLALALTLTLALALTLSPEMRYLGDTEPSQTFDLREEVTAIVRSADAARGDTVTL